MFGGRLSFFLTFILTFLLLLLPPVSRASSARLSSKLSAGLERKLSEARVDAGELIKVWIFFVDKGEGSGTNTTSIAPALSARAKRRRMLRCGGRVDYYDLPVYPGYIEAVREHVAAMGHRSRYLNGVSVLATHEQVVDISSLPFVRSLDLVVSARIPCGVVPIVKEVEFPECALKTERMEYESGNYGGSTYQLEQIGLIPLLNEGYNASGFKGSGEPVRVAVLDTGFRRDHRSLRGVRVAGEWDFVNNDPVTQNEEWDPPFQDYHGTYVLGTIAGYSEGELVGPAWGAEYLLAKTEMVDTEIVFEEDNWIAAVEWADSAGADVVTSSLGYIDWYTRDELDGNTARCTIAADIAVSKGIVVVNAAGNRGADGLIAPADGDSVLAAGAVDRNGNISSFSSRGPTADGRIKPDLVAMGVDVYTVSIADTGDYWRANGTSFSAPLIAGGCAVLLEIHPDWDPVKIMRTVKETSSRSYHPDNVYGWGVPDFALASGLNLPGYAAHIEVAGPTPNPFLVETRFSVFMPYVERLNVLVYDASGRMVKFLFSGESGRLWNDFGWDGTNTGGRRVAPGVYFIDIEGPGFRRVLKSVLLY